MASVDFPAIAPSRLTFTPAIYSSASPAHRGLVVSPRLWASQPHSAGLALEFENVSEAYTRAILEAWRLSFYGSFELALPLELLASAAGEGYRLRLLSSSSRGWFFTERPSLLRRSRNGNVLSVKLSTASPPAAVDPFWDDVVFLMQPIEPAGTTQLNDLSSSELVIENMNAAQVVDTPERSLLFNGTSQYLRIANGAWASLAGTRACVECIFIPTDPLPGFGLLIYKGTYGSNESWYLAYDSAGFQVGFLNAGGNYFRGDIAVVPGARYHVAATTDNINNRMRIWVNGVLMATRAGTFSDSSASYVTIGGGVWNNMLNLYLRGGLVGMRVTKSQTRYEEPFIPPLRFPVR